jgi:hypothetical protein
VGERAGEPDAFSWGQKFSAGLIERSRFVPDPRNDGVLSWSSSGRCQRGSQCVRSQLERIALEEQPRWAWSRVTPSSPIPLAPAAPCRCQPRSLAPRHGCPGPWPARGGLLSPPCLLRGAGPASCTAPERGGAPLHPLHDHGPLELGEHAEHLEHGLAGRRRLGVEERASGSECPTGQWVSLICVGSPDNAGDSPVGLSCSPFMIGLLSAGRETVDLSRDYVHLGNDDAHINLFFRRMLVARSTLTLVVEMT